MSPLFFRNGRVDLELPDTTTAQEVRCPYCGRAVPPAKPNTPIGEIGKDFRDHLAAVHPLQLHDLKTTRWQKGNFIRCEPWQPKGRALRSRKEPRGNHGLHKIVSIGGGEPESDDEWVTVICRCGWTGLSVHGTKLAWHELRIHYRNDYRLVCPHCDWYYEDQDSEHAARTMAQHIGTGHPERFPWGHC